MKMAKVWKKGNNRGRGFMYQFANGANGWTYGFTAAELKTEELKNGKLIRYIPA